MLKAYWAGSCEAGGIFVAATNDARARYYAARELFTAEDFTEMRHKRMPMLDEMIDQERRDPHWMDLYLDLSSYYTTEE